MTWYRLRGPRPEDLPFITQTYVRGAERSLPSAQREHVDWPSMAERFVAECVTSGACVVAYGLMRHKPGDESAIVGYGLGAPRADRATAEVHWLHVKGLYRRHGVGSSLLEAITGGAPRVYVTHRTTRWHAEAIRKRPGWVLTWTGHPITRWDEERQSA